MPVLLPYGKSQLHRPEGSGNMRRMFRFLRHLLFCLLLAPPAWAGSLALVLSDGGGPYAEFETGFREAIENGTWKILPGGLDSPSGRPDLIVAVGNGALRQVLGRGGNTPVIATLLPRQSYEKISAEFGTRGTRKMTAIYLDQPPVRQAAFIRHLLPDRKRIGMLTSSDTLGVANQFRQTFAASGLSIDSEDSDTDRTLLPALNALLPRVGLLLATPDQVIYRRDNIKAILVTSYRYRRPVVAFSAAFVNAGALAALYSTPAQIARQTAELVNQFNATLPPPMAPAQFAIAINPNVAQALDLDLPDEATIRRAMLGEREAR